MRDVISFTLMLTSAVWFSLGFAYADKGMLFLSVAFGLMTLLFRIYTAIIDRKRALKREFFKAEKFTCIRYGDEFFLQNDSGMMRVSNRKEVSDLFVAGRISSFK